MQNKKRFSELMGLLSLTFDKEITKPLNDVYFAILKNYDDESCEKAFMECLTGCKFFPKPAELLEAMNGAETDKATEAWAKVDKAMREIGNYDSVDFGDRKIHKCIEILGGWDYLGTLTEADWKWKRKEFESLYKGIQSADGPDYIPGLAEKNNALLGRVELKGYELPTPERVGVPVKSLQLIRGRG